MNSFIKGTNKYLLGLVILLCIITGVQTWFLLQKNQKNPFNKTQIYSQNGPLFPPDVSIDSWDALEEMKKMQEHMDKLFEERFKGHENIFPKFDEFISGKFSTKQYQLKEENDSYIITADLPDLDETNLKVTLKDQVLTISGSINKTLEQKEENRFFRKHQRTEQFNQSLMLPGPVKPDSLNVSYKDNLLIVKVAKDKRTTALHHLSGVHLFKG